MADLCYLDESFKIHEKSCIYPGYVHCYCDISVHFSVNPT